ncbi:hypothetical protein CRG98_047297 [Punica granatum]|uniref:Uncharacterized protein n=1 Tax=Punica granatum TaxID=22663 RepID=A0A2I0HKQ7_PUNGR|nr:hypothetical protein CRG98_047297 [Punica granatum]
MPLNWEFTLFEKNRGRYVNKEKFRQTTWAAGKWAELGRRAGPGQWGRTGPNWDAGRTEPLRSRLGRVGCWAERAVGCWTGLGQVGLLGTSWVVVRPSWLLTGDACMTRKINRPR